jgi:LacI family transcriptional regulator
MKNTQVTIKDIARTLKISPSTVSRALKDHPDISPATKKAVRELAQELDYQPNSVALSLRKSKTFTIGVIIPEIVHHFFSTVISGIEDVAYKAGYHVMICQSNESYEREVLSTQALLASRVDGLLVSVARETNDVKHFQSMINKGIPTVFFDRVVNGLDTSSVVVDDFGGAYRAVEHLIKTGCKKIAHLGGPDNLVISQSRRKGYEQALDDYGFDLKQDRIFAAGLTIEDGKKACSLLLEQEELPDAIFAANDPVAIGTLQVLKETGIRVPDEVSVIGFSNEPITSLIDPPMTTVAQPGFEMGQLATQLLLGEIGQGNEAAPVVERKELKTELVIRQSTKK